MYEHIIDKLLSEPVFAAFLACAIPSFWFFVGYKCAQDDAKR